MAPDEGRAAVLLLDLPEAALAGIDLLSFTTTARFQGIKKLPEGWHFVFTSTNSSLSIRHGVWFNVPPPGNDPLSLHVKKWNAQKEDLEQEADEAELLRYRANIGSLWRERLTPYRQRVSGPDNASQKPGTELMEDGLDSDTDWTSLTSHISNDMLNRICGETPDHWTLTTASSANRDLESIPGLSEQESRLEPEKELNFLPIDLKRTWREGATGRERTDAARDRTWALRHLTIEFCQKLGLSDVLGEFQFCFIMTLTLNNYSCLEQWKRILQLVLTSFSAIDDDPSFFSTFLSVLRLQMQHSQDAEGGLFDLTEDGARLLRDLLRRFRFGLKQNKENGSMGDEDVVSELEELELYLKKEHGWEFDATYLKHGILELEDGERVEMDFEEDDEDEETGEYAPVIVEMPGEHQSKAAGSKEEPGMDEDSEDDQDLDDMDARF